MWEWYRDTHASAWRFRMYNGVRVLCAFAPMAGWICFLPVGSRKKAAVVCGTWWFAYVAMVRRGIQDVRVQKRDGGRMRSWNNRTGTGKALAIILEACDEDDGLERKKSNWDHWKLNMGHCKSILLDGRGTMAWTRETR